MVANPNDKPEPLTERAPEESVLRALAQSAYPAEFVAANEDRAEVAEPDES